MGKREELKQAVGVRGRWRDTNIALAERDYSIECEAPAESLIVQHRGYFIWWCKVHYQPLAWCERDRLQQRLEAFEQAIRALIQP